MKKIFALILAIMMLVTLAACGTKAETPSAEAAGEAVTESSSETSAEKAPTGNYSDKTIALSSQHLGNQFNQGILAGVTAQAEKYGFKLVTANAQSDTAQQVADLENFVQMGVDAIIIGGGEGAAHGALCPH